MSEMKPDWASPPGDTILDLLEERDWTIADFAERLGLPPERISGLLDGTAPITHDIAVILESTLGSTTQFWLARELQYQASLPFPISKEAPHG
ncbi:MAG: helix-turn-helix domain-containing protein [Rectinemataceae bacterium]|nr:helix-turn-helix domain-containing protein [Rectinemataceae bacterium]